MVFKGANFLTVSKYEFFIKISKESSLMYLIGCQMDMSFSSNSCFCIQNTLKISLTNNTRNNGCAHTRMSIPCDFPSASNITRSSLNCPNCFGFLLPFPNLALFTLYIYMSLALLPHNRCGNWLVSLLSLTTKRFLIINHPEFLTFHYFDEKNPYLWVK